MGETAATREGAATPEAAEAALGTNAKQGAAVEVALAQSLVVLEAVGKEAAVQSAVAATGKMIVAVFIV